MSLNEDNDSRDFFITVATMFVAGPFVYVVIPIVALEFTRPNRRWWIISLSIIILLLSVLQTGRRSMLLYFVVVFVYILFSNSDFFKSNGKKLKLFLFTGLFIGLLLSSVSWISSQRDTSFKETGYVYFGGGIAGFSNRIERIDNNFFGAATLHGTIVPVMIANKYLTKSYPSWWKELDALVEAADEIKIGPNEYMNAFTTMFYVPYIDFGWIGLVVIPFILGIIYRNYYRRSKLNLNSTSRIVYSLLIIGLAGSMYTLYITQSPYILSFLYVPILFKNK
jgi:oligosaccharide repeat unit polymerase